MVTFITIRITNYLFRQNTKEKCKNDREYQQYKYMTLQRSCKGDCNKDIMATSVQLPV